MGKTAVKVISVHNDGFVWQNLNNQSKTIKKISLISCHLPTAVKAHNALDLVHQEECALFFDAARTSSFPL